MRALLRTRGIVYQSFWTLTAARAPDGKGGMQWYPTLNTFVNISTVIV